MSSVVYCIHNKEGCKWSDQLRRLKVSLVYIFLISILISIYYINFMTYIINY